MFGTHWFWQFCRIMLCCTLEFWGFSSDWHPLFQIPKSSPADYKRQKDTIFWIKFWKSDHSGLRLLQCLSWLEAVLPQLLSFCSECELQGQSLSDNSNNQLIGLTSCDLTRKKENINSEFEKKKSRQIKVVKLN